ncbi:FAD-dependent oxidoreductase [Actinomycetospora sp. TBRC 11914]|uniref:FAD-dependent oxidoreductase n=1 Tax=Actinomycetospora sp. TBRC 11914 TaxID=2729387 RepID=UPI00145F0BDE|nr:FAD-dependent oxidoreductase [Actinomycetospora sp. TBRC 11914]NMO91700.1 FAD-dependent oxidoreductase [Actinomycetospora sp. TBRC 11914]
MSSTRPHHVAVVGSGPSGFYAAAALLDADLDVRVDVLDRLATPWGLVRGGVAPDHPKIKSVSAQYAKTAARDGFRFFGHVEVGACDGEAHEPGCGRVDRAELLERYDAVIYAVGSQTERRLDIPGEDLPGSIASVDFVGWYNGHPDHAGLEPALDSERAVVVGAGNVALDVARMLVLPVDDLRATDTADHALEALARSSVRKALVCGRRGAAQAAFTTTELRELDKITGLAVRADPEQVPEGMADDESLAKGTRRNLEALRRWATTEPDPQADREIAFRFLRSPVEIRGEDRVEEIVLAVNRLETGDDGRVRAVDTGERETVPTGLVVRAVGYRGLPLSGLPFDEATGTVPHAEGCVEGCAREYVAGWIKRGPSGIIGTNKKDAHETVRHVLADLAEQEPSDRPSLEDTEKWLRERCPELVDQAGWESIDAHECGRGDTDGRPRVKVIEREEFVRLASA